MVSSKKSIIVSVFLIGILAGGVAYASDLNKNSDSEILNAQCNNQGIFFENHDSINNLEPASGQNFQLDEHGNILYLYDDFSQYHKNQLIIDEFEDSGVWDSSYNTELKISDEYYGGEGSLEIAIKKDFDKLILTKILSEKTNFDNWNETGFISLWMKVPNPDGINSVGVIFQDINGNSRTFDSVPNVHTSAVNTFKDDSEYPDIVFPEGDPKREIWTDFMLGKGWNFIFWNAGKYVDSGPFEIDKVGKVQLVIEHNETAQKVFLDDLRMQPGLQKESNPTQGSWYPPHGRPQYGLYDIDLDSDGQSSLRLLNVRNSQYPSNGDHARMITGAPVPEDFVLRTQLKFVQLGKDSTQLDSMEVEKMDKNQIKRTLLDNTWLRITYDFEPVWDPGHDWFGAYLSMEYDKLGLVSVWPVERNAKQAQEPFAGNLTAATPFVVEQDTEYEIHLLVKGQFAKVEIYKIIDSCLEPEAEISYTFDRIRYGSDKRYPIAIESTGNMRTIIYEVEIAQI